MTLENLGTCYTEEAAAKRLGVSRWTLLRIRERQEISFFKINSRIIYAESHLLQYLNDKALRQRAEPEGAVLAQAA